MVCTSVVGCINEELIKTLGGGSIADLVKQEYRGRAMSFFVLGPIVGPVSTLKEAPRVPIKTNLCSWSCCGWLPQ